MKHAALFFADSHSRRRWGDEQFALRQIAAAARRYKVKKVIGAGDLGDKQSNRAGSVAPLFELADSLEKDGIDFHFLQGQHDWDDPTWLGCHRHAQHLHKQIIEVGPYTSMGLDFQPFGRLQEELKEIPEEVTFLIAHQTWSEWMGSIALPQGDFAQVPGHITHVLTGDYHQYVLEKRKNADGEKMIVCSPGATCMQKSDEPVDHFCVLLGEDGVFRPQQIKSRVFLKSDVLNRPEDLEEFIAGLEADLATALQTAAANDYPEELLRPFLKVSYSHKLTDCVRRVEKLVAGRAILFWRELPPEEKTVSYAKEAAKTKDQAVTPLSVLPDEVDKDKEPQVFELVSRVLQAETPAEEFARWRQEFLGEDK